MDLWAVLVPILLADVLNPVLFAFLVYAAGTRRPVATSASMLLGHTAAYFGAGILLALFLEKITAYLEHPRPIDFVIGGALGLVLLWLALRSRHDQGKRPDDDGPELTPVSAFGFGALVNFVGIPFAVPYFAAIDQILKADLNSVQAVGTLLAYNLAFAAPFALVPVLTAAMGERAKPLLARVNGVMERASAVLMPWILGLLGLALLVDAALYFLTGKPLF
jgi:cytochrome c biogenesis protein CcdA